VIDCAIAANFEGELAIRALSLTDHPQLSLEQFVAMILQIGTDKYDPQRKSIFNEFDAYYPDMHDGRCLVRNGRLVLGPGESSEGADIIRTFYENAPKDRGYPLRIDVLTVYDFHQLTSATKDDPNAPGVSPRLERLLFRFKDPGNKVQALLGVIQILR